jgi:hypothetical protein
MVQTSTLKYLTDFVDRRGDGLVDDLVLISIGKLQLVSGDAEPALDRLFLFGAAAAQPTL